MLLPRTVNDALFRSSGARKLSSMSDAFEDLFGPRRGTPALVTLVPSVAAPGEFARWDNDSSGEPFAPDG